MAIECTSSDNQKKQTKHRIHQKTQQTNTKNLPQLTQNTTAPEPTWGRHFASGNSTCYKADNTTKRTNDMPVN